MWDTVYEWLSKLDYRQYNCLYFSPPYKEFSYFSAMKYFGLIFDIALSFFECSMNSIFKETWEDSNFLFRIIHRQIYC